VADFQTHVAGAAFASGLAATALQMSAAVSNEAVLALFALGITGGMLPDLDSDGSVPIRIAFRLLAVLGGFVPVFLFADRLSLVELSGLGLLSFAVIRFGVFSAFVRFTVHRGLFHSIPAGVLSGMLSAIAATALFDCSPVASWLAASFVTGGFLVHLLLDELCSVNLLGCRIKRSFGTAFRLGSFQRPFATAALYAAIAALWTISPPLDDFRTLALDPVRVQTLRERLLPDGLGPVNVRASLRRASGG
jgi:hypothetical protein